ncbi:MAG: alpha/beta fold hydrolase [Sandaracinaceae bacterium]|nr:alpha/beta fold hydrolase [Sandaracinaceae bacterium]
MSSVAHEPMRPRELVLVHGFLGGPQSWAAVRERLGRAARVTTPTLYGHGDEPSTDTTSFEAELARLLAALGSTRGKILVGYSLGARIALGLAARSAEPFERLVVISGRDGLADEDEARSRRELDDALADTLLAEGLPAFVDRWEALPLFASQGALDVERRAAHRARRRAHRASGVASALRGLSLGRMPRVAADAFARTPRVDLVAGEKDEKFVALARALAQEHGARTNHLACRPKLAVHVVPGAGHDVVLERPDAIAALLEERA